MKSSSPIRSHCQVCGRDLKDTLYVQRGETAYCCEGCHLQVLAVGAIQEERDKAYLVLAEALAAALDTREHETGLHSKRVACHTLVLARRFTSDEAALRQVYWGSLLHDLGKIGIPDAVLLKKGPLDEEERTLMRSHPERGHGILAQVPFMEETLRRMVELNAPNQGACGSSGIQPSG